MLTSDDLTAIQNIIDHSINKATKPMAKDIRKLARDQKLIANFLDKEQIQHRDEIRKIERHVGLPIAI